MTVDALALIGTEIDGFVLEAHAGTGGSASVYKAVHREVPGLVRAFKVMHPSWSARPEFKARLQNEVGAMSGLEHPNIVRFFTLRSAAAGGQSLFVLELEYLEGESLADRIERMRVALPPHEAVRVLAEACKGVGFAHDQGIVHRDLKPENVFLTKDGAVKVLDFGIARARQDADRATRATQEGTAPGTPAYMPPEVWQNDEPTPAADVYALGLTLYEMLLGRHPFVEPGKPTPGPPQYMTKHLQGALPPLTMVQAPLAEIARRATAKDPRDRFANASQLGEALSTLGTRVTMPSPAEAPTKVRMPSEVAVPLMHLPHTTAAVELPRTSSPARAHQPARGSPLRGLRRRGISRETLVVGVAVLAAGTLVGAAAWTFGGRSTTRPTLEPVLRPVLQPVLAPAVPPASSTPPVAAARRPAAAPTPLGNDWVPIRPPASPVVLGVDDRTQRTAHGLRHARNERAPAVAYEIQQHEVTWGELRAWLASHPPLEAVISGPSPSADTDHLPATGIRWTAARDYCTAHGASLPTEAQWEFAARGPEMRSTPWGPAELSFERTAVGRGPSATFAPVMSSVQDVTPTRVYDLLGNAREWVSVPYRNDDVNGTPGDDYYARTPHGQVIGTVRGMSVRWTPHEVYRAPVVPIAWRDPLCATGDCVAFYRDYPRGYEAQLADVGFRCARDAR